MNVGVLACRLVENCSDALKIMCESFKPEKLQMIPSVPAIHQLLKHIHHYLFFHFIQCLNDGTIANQNAVNRPISSSPLSWTYASQ